MAGPAARTVLARVLRPFGHVRPGEGLIALLMFLCVFLILTSYYVMKTAREGLILAGGSLGLRGDELKTYAAGGMAVIFLAIVPAYGALADRVRRIKLINLSYATAIGCLLVFFVLGEVGLPIGLAFFVWLGLSSVFLVAQFWSYASDLYTEEQGKRLFALIALGGSAGAIVGPRLTGLAPTHALILIAAAILVAVLALFNTIERTHRRADSATVPVDAGPLTGEGGFALVLRDRYLLLIAAMLFGASLVNTTGEYILSNAVSTHAATIVPDTTHAELAGVARAAAITADRREVIKGIYGEFFFWVNLVGLVLQGLVVSRLILRLGVRRTLFVLPAIALCAYSFIGAIGGLALVRVAKIVENATDYSAQNTVRQTLFLPTTRVVKYKAKAAIDTFFVRSGDLLSALVVGFGIHQLDLRARDLAFVNLGVIVAWIAIAVGIARRHRILSPDADSSGPPGAGVTRGPPVIDRPQVPEGATA